MSESLKRDGRPSIVGIQEEPETPLEIQAKMAALIAKLIASRVEHDDRVSAIKAARAILAANDKTLKAGAKRLRELAETAYARGYITRDQYKAAIRVAKGERIAFPEGAPK